MGGDEFTMVTDIGSTDPGSALTVLSKPSDIAAGWRGTGTHATEEPRETIHYEYLGQTLPETQIRCGV